MIGIMCDRRAPIKIEGMILRAVVRPAMMYGMETAAMTKKQERQLEVAEKRMPRYFLGVTRKDRIRNEHTVSGQVWTEDQTVKAEMVWSFETSG